MRNWYILLLILLKSRTSESRTLPMRNWYSIHRAAAARLLLPQVGHYLWGIDTACIFSSENSTLRKSDITYEELILRKLADFTLTTQLSERSDITYEELIHTFWSWLQKFFFCVGHYLWGIDTLFILLFWQFLVGHYLWGIDTFWW